MAIKKVKKLDLKQTVKGHVAWIIFSQMDLSVENKASKRRRVGTYVWCQPYYNP